MPQFYMPPECDAYRQMVFDVIRIFVPDFQWAEHGAGEPVTVHCTETACTLRMGAYQKTFPAEGMDENQRRRLIRQEVYRVSRYTSGQPSHPWGIMTGVRPTKIVHRCLDEGMSPAEIGRLLREEYLLSEEKAALLLEVTGRQRAFLPDRQQARQTVSVYLSIPFCPTRCAYCSFPSFCLPRLPLQEEYLTNLLRECRAVGEKLHQLGKQIQTVYIGGGTPTSLSAAQLERLLQGVHRYLDGARLQEFTVEAGRPDTITAEKLQLLHDYQVGRISINPQTFSKTTLDAIGRRHSVEQTVEAYQLARQIGFDSINMDLITGLSGEQVSHFAHSLEQISQLKPENVTVHTLAIKRTARLQLDQLSEQQSSTVQAMHQYLRQWLAGEPYVPYYLYRQKHMVGDQENTGYCLPGKESLYNIQMMEERQTVLGLGVGSTSKYVSPADWTLTQSSNPKDLYYYNQRIDEIIARKLARLEAMEEQEG